MSENNHIYSEQLKLGAYYSYDKNNNKVMTLKLCEKILKS